MKIVSDAIGEKESAILARAITRKHSTQSYFTARLMVDRSLVDDCFRAYAYFRWVDDIVDDNGKSPAERQRFIKTQIKLMESLYNGKNSEISHPEERMLVDLIRHDKRKNGYLESYIRNFLAILEFDSHRKGRRISGEELSWYSSKLGRAVTDVIFYMVGGGRIYPSRSNQYLAAEAAHITHMLRDYVDDIGSGYFNIPKEYLDEKKLSPEDIDNEDFRDYVKQRVELARRYFSEGRKYIYNLDVLRCKIVACWYCARFEHVLDTIERDKYKLRPRYDSRNKIMMYTKMALLFFKVGLRHFFRKKVDK